MDLEEDRVRAAYARALPARLAEVARAARVHGCDAELALAIHTLAGTASDLGLPRVGASATELARRIDGASLADLVAGLVELTTIAASELLER